MQRSAMYKRQQELPILFIAGSDTLINLTEKKLCLGKYIKSQKVLKVESFDISDDP